MAVKCFTLRGAFTLIEVLVVVAIIALLISILMPSLARAREQARQTQCAANLSQIGRAEGAYQTDSREWIPGSPLTTGYWYVKQLSPTWYPKASLPPGQMPYSKRCMEMSDYVTPLRAVIAGPKSIKQPGGAADVTRVRGQLYLENSDGLFHCPSYRQKASGWGPSGYPVINAVSYFTPYTLTRGGPGMYDYAAAHPNEFPGLRYVPPGESKEIGPAAVGQAKSWGMELPSGYMPRHGKLGRESMKVFLVEAARFFDPDINAVTYSTAPKRTKGAYNVEPPSCSGQYSFDFTNAPDLAYRHGNKDTLNALFFDGHVESLKVFNHKSPEALAQRDNFRGDAVHPKYYYPSGTVIGQTAVAELHIKTLQVGTALP